MSKFKRALVGLGIALGKNVDEMLTEVYRAALAEYSDDQLVAAMATAARTCKFFPKPVELIEIIKQQKKKTKLDGPLLGNLAFELAEGGPEAARQWIESQPLENQAALYARLRVMVDELRRPLDGRVQGMIDGIGDSDSQTPPETGQSDADSDDEPEGDTPGD